MIAGVRGVYRAFNDVDTWNQCSADDASAARNRGGFRIIVFFFIASLSDFDDFDDVMLW